LIAPKAIDWLLSCILGGCPRSTGNFLGRLTCLANATRYCVSVRIIYQVVPMFIFLV
jgi:hypothetical protein